MLKMTKEQIARALEEMAAIMELQGENYFKIRAYMNCAQSLLNLKEDFETLIQENRLIECKGIGQALDAKIKTLALTGADTTIIRHLSGRLLLRQEPFQLDYNKVIEVCIANGKIMELNAQPDRLDMDWRYWHKASEKGLLCVINPDAHRIREYDFMQAGINMARKGWFQKSQVINTYPLEFIKKRLGK